MEGKRVTFRVFTIVNGSGHFTPPCEGIFQRWGDAIKYEDEKHFQLTVAIILGDDGKVYSVPPECVAISVT